MKKGGNNIRGNFLIQKYKKFWLIVVSLLHSSDPGGFVLD